MSGCVTVTGPPRWIWSTNVGITLPRLPSTFPKRTAMHRVLDKPSGERTIVSATRLVVPITDVGFTALSVEMKTNASTLCRRASSSTVLVPKMFVLLTVRNRLGIVMIV